MDLNEDPRALEQKIEQATRIASHIGAGAIERLDCGAEAKVAAAYGGETRQAGDQDPGPRNLGRNGRPAGRDLEFWLQAEAEISERK